MSSTPDQVNKILDSERLPKYCQYHKFFLVEELALETDFRELHFGKCAVVGRINLISNDYIALENVRLNNLPPEYTLPVGSVELRLRYFNCIGDKLEHGSFYIVYGEVVLVDVSKSKENYVPKTTRGVHEDLMNLSDENQRNLYLKSLHETHKPALNATIASQIDSADELAELNLCLRLVSER